MKLHTVIFTTSPTDWMAKDLPYIRQQLSQAKGVEIGAIDIRHIKLAAIPTAKDADGDVKPDWDWFRQFLTAGPKGYNSVCLHISRAEQKKYGITVNGTYRRDPDEIFEFWVCANKGEKAKRYPGMSEFARVFLHEQAHGFERFVYGYDVNLVHTYDYDLKQLPDIYRIMDFTEWNRVAEKRDGLLHRLYQLINNKMNTPILPIDETFFHKVTQAFGIRNPRYKSGLHNGTDFACPIGTPIYAPQDGIITMRGGDHPTMGDFVYYSCIIDGTRYWMRFLHLSKVMPLGSYKRGAIIGWTGNSGDSDGPHLHHDVWTVSPDAALIRTEAGVRKYMRDPLAFWEAHVS